jgi:hypothetical protein
MASAVATRGTPVRLPRRDPAGSAAGLSADFGTSDVASPLRHASRRVPAGWQPVSGVRRPQRAPTSPVAGSRAKRGFRGAFPHRDP